jgi:hypothetical protein
MSIGNLQDYGNKGNNFPWQLKMLQGFTSMINVLLGNTVGATKVTTILRPTASGTITAGKTSISISNVGTANGSVDLITLKPNETINFDAGGISNTLNAIAYNATGTEFLIITVQ